MSTFYNMPEIKNLKKAAKRILKAVKNKERIILYGDADLDGIGAVVILEETIKNLGGQIASVYFPDREIEGYGINKSALNILKDKAPALFISLDLGIGNFEEIKIAEKLGFELLIIDHHQILDKLPEASIIVNPNQKGDKYPFKKFATVGLVFELSKILLKKNFSENLKQSFLELTALATIFDMMPETDDNEAFIAEGVRSLETTFRPGLKVFFKTDLIKECNSTRHIAQKIISALGAGERIDHLNETYLLLKTSSEEEAENLAKILIEKSSKKQLRTRKIVEEIEERMVEKPQDPIVFEGNPLWPLVLTGPVASKICRQYGKPTFIFKINGEESVGGVRTPKEMNSVEAMKSCSNLLMTYGGHPQASGFRLKNENLEKFKECLIEYFKKHSEV